MPEKGRGKRPGAGNGDESELYREVIAATAKVSRPTASLLQRVAARLAQLEATEFAGLRMAELLDAIARRVKGRAPPGGHHWHDLPDIVTRAKPDTTPHPRVPRVASPQSKRRKKSAHPKR